MNQSARQMLASLPDNTMAEQSMPVRMADGGAVTDAQIRTWLAANPGASDAQISQAMNTYGVSPARLAAATGYDAQEVTRRYDAVNPAWTPGDSVGRQRALERGDEAGWLAQVKTAADKYMAQATPGTAAEAYDTMIRSGIGIKDLLDSGVSQTTIDKALSIETAPEQTAVNTLTQKALTSTLSQNPNVTPEVAARGTEAIYTQARQFVENLQKDGVTPQERQYMQQVASQQGWGYSDLRAAGIDPSLLFNNVVPPPVVPPPVFPDPKPYTPVTVYDPEKFAREQGGDDLYKKGEVALDTAFRSSPVRQVSPTTGQYTYTPAASLRPATGSGWNWKPPVVTSRPRELLDVGPTASASQQYAQSRQQQDRALRDAFASSNLPMSGANTYYWQSRLRGGDYSPGGTFDPTKFGQDFQSWAANQGSGTSGTAGQSQTGSTVGQNQQMYDEFGNPLPSTTANPNLAMAPKMFLNMQPELFADGGEARARELLDRIKKPEGGEESSPAASGRSWEGGRSPEQNRRFNRIKPALDRERERLEAWYDRHPEDFYARIFADLPPEERRYMEYVMAGLPPEHRFDAPGGLMSLIGYGTGDNRATISEYSVKDKREDGFVSPRVLGFYPGSNFKRSQEDYPHDDPRLQWAPGQGSPDAQAGIAVFSPTEDNIISEKYREGVPDPALSSKDIYGTRVMRSRPNTVWHELFHRGTDSPFLTGPIGESLTEPRFYEDDHKTIASLMQEYAAENAENLPSDLPFDPEQKRKYYNETVEEITRFLTPEREAQYQVTRYHDPSERSFMERITEDVLRKKDGGEVTTEELIAQMDRAAGTPNVKTEEPEQTESRSMLRRINDTFGRNVTAPVLGSIVDMSVGLGDIGQFATKYLANRAGIETAPVTPVASNIKSKLGLEYDPYHPVAIATQLGLPALSRARAMTRTIAASPAVRAVAAPPGSAKELMERVGGEAAREGQIYVGSELGAQTAREIAPDNAMAEIVGAMIGGTAVNTAQNLDPRTVNNITQAQMESYNPYLNIRGREYPFVGRLDQYVADNIEGTLTKDQFLGQIRPKFRRYDILRAEQALSDLGGKDKVTASDLLTRLEQVYDPADYKVSFYPTTEIPYKSYGWDDPWKRGISGTSSTGRVGAIVLTRGGMEGEAPPSINPNTLQQGRDILQEFTTNRAGTADAFARGEYLGRIFILRDIVKKLPESTQQNRLRYYLSDLEDVVGQRASIAEGLDLLQEDKGFLLKSATQDFFEAAYLEAIERGGAPPDQLVQQAFDTAISRAYRDQMQYLPGYNEFFPVDLDLTGAVNYNDKVQAIHSQIGPAAARAKQKLTADTQNKIDRTLTSMEGYMPEFEKLFAPVATKPLPLGSNRGVKIENRHLGIPGNENPIGFSRFTEVMTTLPGATQPARGVYIHEMQSDLLKPLRKQGVPRSAPEDQLRELIQQQRDIEAAKAAQIKTLEDSLVPLREQVNTGAMTYEEFVNSPVHVDANAKIPRLADEESKARLRARSLQKSLDTGPSARPVDEAFPGMERNSKALQQLLIKNAVAGAIDQGYSFVALTAPTQSKEAQLYQRIPQNARDVVMDLGEGFRVVDLTLEGNGGPFKTTAIVWGNDAEGREGVNRVKTRGVPFAQGGEVTSKPDDIKNLLSFLDK